MSFNIFNIFNHNAPTRTQFNNSKVPCQVLFLGIMGVPVVGAGERKWEKYNSLVLLVNLRIPTDSWR